MRPLILELKMLMAILAQVAAENPTALYVYGPLGIMVGWFMWQGTRFAENMKTQIGEVVNRIDTLSKAMMLDVLTRDSSGVHAKSQAREIIAEIDSKQAKKGK